VLRAGLTALLLLGLASCKTAEGTERTGAGKTDAPTASAARAALGGGSRWGADYFPNIELTTHEGKKVRFFDDLIKGKVVVINFIFTSCRKACPLETARLKKVQELLGDRVGKDVFMYSISIDPETDTPEVLADYVKRFRLDPGWYFLTGNREEIVLLRKKLGLFIEEVQAANPEDHSLTLIIGNQTTGQWMKRSPMENPHFLAMQIGSWLHNWKMPDPNANSYADAPKLHPISKGEDLFRTRCVTCHTIGGGNILNTTKSLVGPDLLGVTQRRDRAWLERWLAEPDKMLDEGDPIATGLYAQFNKVAMPNLELNEVEIAALLEFIETESRRVQSGR
jgi:protein SCO1/2